MNNIPRFNESLIDYTKLLGRVFALSTLVCIGCTQEQNAQAHNTHVEEITPVTIGSVEGELGSGAQITIELEGGENRHILLTAHHVGNKKELINHPEDFNYPSSFLTVTSTQDLDYIILGDRETLTLLQQQIINHPFEPYTSIENSVQILYHHDLVEEGSSLEQEARNINPAFSFVTPEATPGMRNVIVVNPYLDDPSRDPFTSPSIESGDSGSLFTTSPNLSDITTLADTLVYIGGDHPNNNRPRSEFTDYQLLADDNDQISILIHLSRNPQLFAELQLFLQDHSINVDTVNDVKEALINNQITEGYVTSAFEIPGNPTVSVTDISDLSQPQENLDSFETTITKYLESYSDYLTQHNITTRFEFDDGGAQLTFNVGDQSLIFTQEVISDPYYIKEVLSQLPLFVSGLQTLSDQSTLQIITNDNPDDIKKRYQIIQNGIRIANEYSLENTIRSYFGHPANRSILINAFPEYSSVLDIIPDIHASIGYSGDSQVMLLSQKQDSATPVNINIVLPEEGSIAKRMFQAAQSIIEPGFEIPYIVLDENTLIYKGYEFPIASRPSVADENVSSLNEVLSIFNSSIITRSETSATILYTDTNGYEQAVIVEPTHEIGQILLILLNQTEIISVNNQSFVIEKIMEYIHGDITETIGDEGSL